MEHPKLIGDRSALAVMRFARSYAHHPNPKQRFRRYGDSVDFYGVHCPDNGGVYLVPAAELTNHFAARIELPTAGLAARAGGSGSSA